MIIYKVCYKRYNDEHTVNVSAKDAAQAVEFTNRYTKKKHFYASEILSVEKVLDVHVHYKGK